MVVAVILAGRRHASPCGSGGFGLDFVLAIAHLLALLWDLRAACAPTRLHTLRFAGVAPLWGFVLHRSASVKDVFISGARLTLPPLGKRQRQEK